MNLGRNSAYICAYIDHLVLTHRTILYIRGGWGFYVFPALYLRKHTECTRISVSSLIPLHFRATSRCFFPWQAFLFLLIIPSHSHIEWRPWIALAKVNRKLFSYRKRRMPKIESISHSSQLLYDQKKTQIATTNLSRPCAVFISKNSTRIPFKRTLFFINQDMHRSNLNIHL